ncbi:hypothetical protein LINPERPRIM_LOCUS42401, partial [Linum perenne]
FNLTSNFNFFSLISNSCTEYSSFSHLFLFLLSNFFFSKFCHNHHCYGSNSSQAPLPKKERTRPSPKRC